MPGQDCSALLGRWNELDERKANFMNYGQVAAKYCIPQKANITRETVEGGRVSTEVYDSTAINASQICASGLQAFLLSDRFFQFEYEDEDLRDDSEAKEWLAAEEQGVYDVLNGSNFQNQMGEFLHDFCVLPGATMYQEPDPDDITRFMNLEFKGVNIGVDHRGMVNELHYRREYTVKQMYERFGKNCSEKIMELWNEGKYDQKFIVQFSVAPRYMIQAGKKDAMNMPFYACWSDVKHKKKMVEKGYKYFPFTVGRWRLTSGSDWGYTPAMIGISDILGLNEIQKTVLMSGQQKTSPPWLFPHQDYIAPLNFNPGSLNWANGMMGTSGEQRDWKPFPMIHGGDLGIGFEFIEMMAKRINSYFFTDLFLPLLDKQATAFEVAKVIEKKMTILGAVVGGFTKNVIEPTLNNTRRIRREHPRLRGKVLPYPQAFGDIVEVKIKYNSPLAIAQKAALTQNEDAFLGFVGQLMAVNPEARHTVKWDEAARERAQTMGINPKILSSKQEYDEAVQADREAQSQANTIAMMGAGGQAVESIGKGVQSLQPNDKKKVKK